jgi:hypothetical protein
VALVLLGVAGLVLKGHYDGPSHDIVRSYAGNIAVSFAVYFVVANLPFPTKLKLPLTVGFALGVVELFEALDGFGVMSNTYDPMDYAANAVGVSLAVAIDLLTRRRAEQRSSSV